jgi:hypothetical protein
MKAGQDKGASKKTAARSANAHAPTKARTSSSAAKKATTAKKAVAKKSAPAKKTAFAGKTAKGSPKAFAGGGAASAAPAQRGTYIQRQPINSVIVQAAKAVMAKKAAPAAAKKAAPAVAKNAGQEKLVPFAGWAPLTSANQIVSLQKARTLFSEDQSFED